MFFQPAQDVIDGAFADEQAVVFGEASFDFIAVHCAVLDVIEDGQVEQALSELAGPILEEGCIHGFYNTGGLATCQCHLSRFWGQGQ